MAMTSERMAQIKRNFGDGHNVITELLDENERLWLQNDRFRSVVALLNSMVLSGESHSEESRGMMREALDS